jgi:S-adenosylmethionine/arginine decarboxylase-like enzyme
MDTRAWGWITCIDAAECDNDLITSPDNFQAFIDELLERIEMVAIGDLHVVWCETHDPKKFGHSIFQLLQDSNVAAHFCPADGNDAYMDIFSCKPYEEELVLEIFKKYFKPKAVHSTKITRRAPR